MELLRMGWNERQDSLLLVSANPESREPAEPRRVLEQIAVLALKHNTSLIVLDMLFDFTGFQDELSYAQTRNATRPVQQLADLTKAHVYSTHHAPKYLTDLATAGTAALGSQGIAARFSPILLSRHWGADLYTVESTMTRDPRGLAIPQTCVALDERGWLKEVGEFKNWMKWKLYAPRVKGLFESAEPGTEYGAATVARDLEIDRAQAQNTLYQLVRAGELQRVKSGRSYRYFLPRSDLPSDGLFDSGGTF
jgi:hypothetical protein